MIPNAGTWVGLTFISKFTALNGIYRIDAIQSFDSAIASKVDFVNLLYKPAGLSETDYNNDLAGFTGHDVIWVKPADTSRPNCPIPASLLLNQPDLDVGKYYPLILRINMGYWADPSQLATTFDAIAEIVTCVTGVSSDALKAANNKYMFWTTPKSGVKMMKNSDYKKMDSDRSKAQTAYLPLQEKVTEMQKTIDSQKTQIATLNALLVQAYKVNHGET